VAAAGVWVRVAAAGKSASIGVAHDFLEAGYRAPCLHRRLLSGGAV
jgi:hypothetical protein